MTLEDWDIQVRPHLVGIEAGVAVVMRHALALPCKPDFVTIAEDDLAKVQEVLGNAIVNIAKAQELYRAKTLERA